MKNLGKTLICGIAALLAITAMADAPETAKQFTPKLMNYQGYLADPTTGKAYADGIYHLQCRLYRVAVEGTAIWGGEYAVYVNGGYFNIMLGDPSAQELEDENCTYSNTNLWRAIWSDASVADENERNNLWLGVTPLENSKNNAITSPTEIKPRQQLLTAPYAFRAQSAEYANESPGDFTVNGKLKVDDSITSSSDLKLAPQDGNNIDITVPFERALYVRGGHIVVTNASNTMIADDQILLQGKNTIVYGAEGLQLSSITSPVSLESPNGVRGQGDLKWKSTASGTFKKPFIIKDVIVTFENSNHIADYTIQDDGYRYWVSGLPTDIEWCRIVLYNDAQVLHAVANSKIVYASVYFTLVGVLKELVDDQRPLFAD